MYVGVCLFVRRPLEFELFLCQSSATCLNYYKASFKLFEQLSWESVLSLEQKLPRLIHFIWVCPSCSETWTITFSWPLYKLIRWKCSSFLTKDCHLCLPFWSQFTPTIGECSLIISKSSQSCRPEPISQLFYGLFQCWAIQTFFYFRTVVMVIFGTFFGSIFTWRPLALLIIFHSSCVFHICTEAVLNDLLRVIDLI